MAEGYQQKPATNLTKTDYNRVRGATSPFTQTIDISNYKNATGSWVLLVCAKPWVATNTGVGLYLVSGIPTSYCFVNDIVKTDYAPTITFTNDKSSIELSWPNIEGGMVTIIQLIKF